MTIHSRYRALGLFVLGLSISTIASQVQGFHFNSTADQLEEPPVRNLVDTKFVGSDPVISLGRCEGDCDRDSDCEGGLVCYQRMKNDDVPGCDPTSKSGVDKSNVDYCVRREDLRIKFVHDRKPGQALLRQCEGDCDSDDDCRGDLICYQRDGMESVRGCTGGSEDGSRTDYCAPPKEDENFEAQSSIAILSAAAARDDVAKTDDTSKAVVISSPKWKPPVIVGSSSVYERRGNFRVSRPEGTKAGDLFVLFLSRTDDVLPLRMNGWKTVASCFKQDNPQPWCLTHTMCHRRNGDYCDIFRRENSRHDYDGRDLATIVMTRVVTKKDALSKNFRINLKGNHAGWAIMVTVRGAYMKDPIRSWKAVSCDRVRETVFASTYGKKSDLMLMHQGYDDTSDMQKFMPPPDSHFISFTKGPDEAGFLFAGALNHTGETGDRTTRGPGGPPCKDVNVAVIIRRSYA